MVGGLGSCNGGSLKAEKEEKERSMESGSDESVERLMSLSRWPPPPCEPSARSRAVASGELWEPGLSRVSWWRVRMAFCRVTWERLRACWMVRSSMARWHVTSSWLVEGEAFTRRGDEERETSEGRGMEMGELMLSFLVGGEDEEKEGKEGKEEVLMLREEPSRCRKLPPVSFGSFCSFSQGIFSGMLHCLTGGGGTGRCGGWRRGGGR